MPRFHLSLFSCFRPHTPSSKPENRSSTADLSTAEQKQGGPVVVELFSSQGCATSPQAEILVSRLGRGDFQLGAPVLVLAYHVDYWDYMGWKDPFGSSQWTVRQKAYVESLRLDTMFTPQVVVQGRSQLIGTDQDALLNAITTAPRFPPLSLQATFQKISPNTLQVSLSGSLKSKPDTGGSNIMVGLTENGLITDCPRGENQGKILANDFVVRKLEKLTSVNYVSAKQKVSVDVSFQLRDGFNNSKCTVAVFVQDSSHHIFGSQSFSLPENL
ncbi:unnamed protein product [Rhodiola kirilowii]